MKTRFTIIFAAALAALALAGCAKAAPGIGNAAAGAGAAASAGGASPGGGAPVAEAKHVDAFGVVKAKSVHEVFMEFPALVERKLVTDGQKVRLGETLFRFSRTEYDALVSDKSYELIMAQLDLKKATLAAQKLHGDQDAARVDVDKAQKDLNNLEKLRSMGGKSQSDIDEAQRTLLARQQKVREVQFALEEYEASEVNGLDARKAKIAIVERQLARLQEQASRPFIANDAIVCDVREGVVSEIGYSEGDFVSVGKKLCSVSDLGSIIVEANIPEEFIKDVKLGTRATVVPLADNSRSYTGTVTRISNMAGKNNGETIVPVEITLAAADGFLLPNFNVDVSIY
jgi:multidrug resistance efflux pump